MPKITYVSYSGAAKTVDVPLKNSIMEGAIHNDIDGILAECGGACLCATCHVYVDEAFLPLIGSPDESEDAMLESTACDRKPNSRLSCQIFVKPDLDGLVVHLPESQK